MGSRGHFTGGHPGGQKKQQRHRLLLAGTGKCSAENNVPSRIIGNDGTFAPA